MATKRAGEGEFSGKGGMIQDPPNATPSEKLQMLHATDPSDPASVANPSLLGMARKWEYDPTAVAPKQ